jgi:hypothetical protein
MPFAGHAKSGWRVDVTGQLGGGRIAGSTIPCSTAASNRCLASAAGSMRLRSGIISAMWCRFSSIPIIPTLICVG